jgi:hypothetical protein
VWLSDGNIITPAFIRNIVVPHIFTIIAARKGAIQHELDLHARRTGEHQPGGHILVSQIKQLQSEVANRYEIEAIELAKPAARRISATSTDFLASAVRSKNESGNTPEVVNWVNTKAETWRDLREKFQALAEEEQGRTPSITRGEVLGRINEIMRAYYNYQKHPEGWGRGKLEQGLMCLLDTPPYGVWNISDGVSENFRERVRLCIARSGVALACPRDTDPEDFWLHQLYLDLLKNNSDLLFAASEEGGMILSICVASATFCSRLEKNALGMPTATPSPLQKGNRNTPLVFLESAGDQTSRDTPRPAMSYPKFRTKTLQNTLNKIDGRLVFLKSKFPDWKVRGSGYGPGNQTPEFYTEIRRLEKERENILVELSKRLKSEALSELVKPKARRAKRTNAGMNRSPKRIGHADERKGDPSLLGRKERVAFRTAEQYLGVTERQRQNLIKRGSLTVEGQGHNRKITTESLRKYLPPENPK